MASFLDISNNMIFLALFILAGFAFVVIVQGDNDSTQPIYENALFNKSYVNLQKSLNSLDGTSEGEYTQFTEEQPKTGFGSIVLFGIVSVGRTFGDFILTAFTLLIKLPLIVLGIPQSVTSIFTTWLILSLIVSAWILYKLGG